MNADNIAKNLSNDAWSGYAKCINNFTLAKNSKLQIAINYAAPTVTPQGTRIAVYNTDWVFQQKISIGTKDEVMGGQYLVDFCPNPPLFFAGSACYHPVTGFVFRLRR